MAQLIGHYDGRRNIVCEVPVVGIDRAGIAGGRKIEVESRLFLPGIHGHIAIERGNSQHFTT